METKTNIYKKLLEFQRLNISVHKDGKNPHFKNSYATLNEVLDKVKAPLNKLGIVIIFNPEPTGLRTILYDTESDTRIESFMQYVNVGNAQNLLACNTYFRRGSLVSLLGLEDEDDDGNKASEPIKKELTKEQVEVALAKLIVCGNLEDLKLVYKGLTVAEQTNKEIISEVNKLKESFKVDNINGPKSIHT